MNTSDKTRPLQGQRALVTGADTGIGGAVAEALGDAGAKVMVNYLDDRDAAEQVAERIRAKEGQAMIFQADVSEENQVKSLFDVLVGYWGSIDILVNNAGLQQDAALLEMSLSQWNKVIGVNLTGQFLCTREAVREFLRRGVQPGLSASVGKIICLSSAPDVNFCGQVNYAASQGGVVLLMKSLAEEFAKDKIRVNGIATGVIKTPFNTATLATTMQAAGLLKPIPSGTNTPEDIAKALVWLVSDEADTINGATFYIG